MGTLDPLEARLASLLAASEPKARRELARQIARDLRASTARRIAAQQNPDGTPFEPRRLRRKRPALRQIMFMGLRKAKYLKAEATADAAVVTFTGDMQRVAQVHQFGLRDRVAHHRNAPVVTYPARALLGLSDADAALVEEAVLGHLAKT